MNTYVFFAFLLAVLAACSAYPGNVRYEKVRIHVPTKVRTIYKTQIVKVPEHHHHHHEKVKEVPKYVVVTEKHVPHLEHSHLDLGHPGLSDEYEK